MTTEPQKNQSCPNPNCTAFGLIDDTNISIHDSKNNRFKCRQCNKTWVGNREDFTYRLRVNPVRINRAFDLLKAGISIRKTAEFSHVSPSTVMRWKKRINASQ